MPNSQKSKTMEHRNGTAREANEPREPLANLSPLAMEVYRRWEGGKVARSKYAAYAALTESDMSRLHQAAVESGEGRAWDGSGASLAEWATEVRVNAALLELVLNGCMSGWRNPYGGDPVFNARKVVSNGCQEAREEVHSADAAG